MVRVDVLMIAYNRPSYTERSLPRLLESCVLAQENGIDARVWVWQNGTDAQTCSVVQQYQEHACMEQVYWSDDNKMLREPTNWFWRESRGDFVGKVDDDILISMDWLSKLVKAHQTVPRLGLCGAWQFLEEDFVPKLAMRKIRSIADGLQIMANPWIGGSGYLMKREVLKNIGQIAEDESFSAWCLRASRAKWVVGWYYPFIQQEDMDDPRHPWSLKKTDEDMLAHASLSQRRYAVTTLQDVIRRQKMAAWEVQASSPNVSDYIGLRGKIRRVVARLRRTGRVARFHA